MSEYRIAEKKNCFDRSRFYVQWKQGNGAWEDIIVYESGK